MRARWATWVALATLHLRTRNTRQGLRSAPSVRLLTTDGRAVDLPIRFTESDHADDTRTARLWQMHFARHSLICALSVFDQESRFSGDLATQGPRYNRLRKRWLPRRRDGKARRGSWPVSQ